MVAMHTARAVKRPSSEGGLRLQAGGDRLEVERLEVVRNRSVRARSSAFLNVDAGLCVPRCAHPLVADSRPGRACGCGPGLVGRDVFNPV